MPLDCSILTKYSRDSLYVEQINNAYEMSIAKEKDEFYFSRLIRFLLSFINQKQKRQATNERKTENFPDIEMI